MKTYRGLIEIDCGRDKKPCPQKYQKNVQAACLNCDLAEVRVVDLDRKPLAVLWPAPEEIEPKPASAPEIEPAADKKTTKEE